jgi:hypothetical protein
MEKSHKVQGICFPTNHPVFILPHHLALNQNDFPIRFVDIYYFDFSNCSIGNGNDRIPNVSDLVRMRIIGILLRDYLMTLVANCPQNAR